jgi:hypothetical protein
MMGVQLRSTECMVMTSVQLRSAECMVTMSVQMRWFGTDSPNNASAMHCNSTRSGNFSAQLLALLSTSHHTVAVSTATAASPR